MPISYEEHKKVKLTEAKNRMVVTRVGTRCGEQDGGMEMSVKGHRLSAREKFDWSFAGHSNHS